MTTDMQWALLLEPDQGICIKTSLYSQSNKTAAFSSTSRDENCYQCLLMMKRHKNIIQYKESKYSNISSVSRSARQI